MSIWCAGNQPPDVVFRQLGLQDGQAEGMEQAARRLQAEWIRIVSAAAGRGAVYFDVLRTVNNTVVGVRPRTTPHKASFDDSDSPPVKDSGDFARSIKIREKQIAFTARVQPASNAQGRVFVAGTGGTAGISALTSDQDHWQVYSDDIAARIMEWGLSSGTPGAAGPHPAGIVIMPRPSARPALVNVLPEIKADLVGALRTSRARPGRSVSLINLIRRGIIQFSTVIGNLSAIGIRIPALTALRGKLLRAGTQLGDLNALAKGTIDQRILTRVVGRGERRVINNMTRGFGSIGGRIARRATVGPANHLLNRIKFPSRI